MKQALAPGNSTTFDQLQLVITRTRSGEGLGIAMRDEGVAGEFDVVVWQVNRSMRAYGIIREGDRVLTIGGKPARNAARAAKLMSGGKKVKVKVQRPTGLHAVGNHELEEKAREQSVDAYIARTVREDDEDDELGLAMAVSRDAAMLTEGSAGSSAAGAAASASASSSSAEVELQLAEAPRPKGKGKARAL